jgi:hypothetical protein
MIKLQFKKPILIESNNVVAWPNAKSVNLYAETQRRDNIIKNLAIQFFTKFSIGDSVVFKGDKDIKGLVIAGCASNYTQLGKTESWPDTDMPMIVTIYSKEKKTTYHCTINAIEPA